MSTTHGLKLNRIIPNTLKPSNEKFTGNDCLGLPSSTSRESGGGDTEDDEEMDDTSGTVSTASTSSSNSCTIVHIITDWSYYESITTEDVRWQLYQALTTNKNMIGILDDGSVIKYIGNQLIEQTYSIILDGVPKGAVINPIQRRYMSDVTYNFLDQFVTKAGGYDVVVYGVSIESQTTIAERRRRQLRQLQQRRALLRGISGSSTSDAIEDGNKYDEDSIKVVDHTNLRSQKQQQEQSHRRLATLEIPAIVYGIGNPLEKDDYFSVVEEAFTQNQERFMLELSSNQFRPSEINDFNNLGTTFQDLINVQVVPVAGSGSNRGDSNSTNSGGGGSDEGLFVGEMYIYIWSGVLGLSFIWLVYRIAKDYFLVSEDLVVQKKERLSERQARLKEEQQQRRERRKERKQQRRERRNRSRRGGFGDGDSDDDDRSHASRWSRFGRGRNKRRRRKNSGSSSRRRDKSRSPSPAHDQNKMEALLAGNSTELTSNDNSPQGENGHFRRSAQDLVPSTPRNRAGERGRGISASQSLPVSPRKSASNLAPPGSSRMSNSRLNDASTEPRNSGRNFEDSMASPASLRSHGSSRSRGGKPTRSKSFDNSLSLNRDFNESDRFNGPGDEYLVSLDSKDRDGRSRHGGKPSKSKSFDSASSLGRGSSHSERSERSNDRRRRSSRGSDFDGHGSMHSERDARSRSRSREPPRRSRSAENLRRPERRSSRGESNMFDGHNSTLSERSNHSRSRGARPPSRSKSSEGMRRPQRRSSRSELDGHGSMHSERSGRSRGSSRAPSRARSADNLKGMEIGSSGGPLDDYLERGGSSHSGPPSRTRSSDSLSRGSSHSHRSSASRRRERETRAQRGPRTGTDFESILENLPSDPSVLKRPGSLRGVKRADSMPRNRAGERRGISASRSMEARPRPRPDDRLLCPVSSHSATPRNKAGERRGISASKSMEARPRPRPDDRLMSPVSTHSTSSRKRPPRRKKKSMEGVGSDGSRPNKNIAGDKDVPPAPPRKPSKTPSVKKSPSSSVGKSPRSGKKSPRSGKKSPTRKKSSSVDASPASSTRKSVGSQEKLKRKKSKEPKKSNSTELKNPGKKATRPDPPQAKTTEEEARWEELRQVFLKYSNYSLKPGESESRDAVVESFRRHDSKYASKEAVSDEEIGLLLDDWYYRKIRKTVSDDGVYEGFHLNPGRPENVNGKSPEEQAKWEKQQKEFLEFSNYRLLPGKSASRDSIVQAFREHHRHYSTKDSISDSTVIELLDDWYNSKVGRSKVGEDLEYEGIQVNPRFI